MVNKEYKSFLFVILLSLIIVNTTGQIFYTYENQILLFLIPLIWPGLAHGSLDLEIVINRGVIKGFGHKILFFIIYVTLIICFFYFWLIFPDIGFLIFLLLSMIHFGISDRLSKIKINRIVEIIFRGMAIIILPLMFHQDKTLEIFQFFGLSYETLNSIQFLSNYFFYLLIFFFSLWIILREKSKVLKFKIFFEFILIIFCFIYFEPIISFLIYFCFLHSIRHLNDEKKILNLTYKDLFLKTLPFTIIPLVILLFYILIIDLDHNKNLYYTLIGLSSLTIPHVILVNLLKN